MQKKYLPVRQSKSKAFLMIGIVTVIYILDSLSSRIFNNYIVYSNFIKPILWLSMAGLVYALPRARSRAPLKLRGSINWWAFIFAAAHLACLIIAGSVEGFGKSPYDHTLYGIFINILVVSSMLLGCELVRSYVINSFTDRENYFIFILFALFMTLVCIPIYKYTKLSDYQDIVKFIGQSFAPEFCKNLFANYLAFLGGPVTTIIYLGTLSAFEWLSPVLPNLKWIITAFVGILCPIFSFTLMQNIYASESKLVKKREMAEESPVSWIVTSIISISIIWFSVGIFPIYPSVIATGSMEPMIEPGDIIIVEKHTENSTFNIGDVIQFARDNILISHRIIDVKEEGKKIRYVTKGDNNSTADAALVEPQHIKGKIVFVVPRIGWLTLQLKSKDNIPPDEIEF